MKKLLSEDLQVLVYEKVAECVGKLNKHYDIELGFPDIRFDLHTTIGGMAIPDHQILRFNLVLLIENQEDYLTNTVPHEVAHLFVPFVFGDVWPRPSGHGSHWHEVMGVLGVPPKMYHNYDVSSLDLFHPKLKRPKTPPEVAKQKKLQSILNSIQKLSYDDRDLISIMIHSLPPPPPRKLTLEEAIARQRKNGSL